MATKFEHEPYPRPDPHTGLALQIAQYLHAAGIVADPAEDQTTTGGVAVYCGGWEDTPNTAVGVMGVSVDHTFDDANPLARFTLAHRADPHDLATTEALAGQTFQALHDRYGLWLTAEQKTLSCTRIAANPALQDQNRRWVRLDMYQAVLAVPTRP